VPAAGRQRRELRCWLTLLHGFHNPQAKQIRRRMSKPVRVRGYNDSLFEDSATDAGLSDARSRRRTDSTLLLPPTDDSDRNGEDWGEEEDSAHDLPRPVMVEASTLTDIDDNDI
jgi:hypothetical protein